MRYLAEQTLAGDAANLKEYVLGVEVFDRGPAFDPASDTIVRVQARRLRQKVEEYYRSEGRLDPILIGIPTGQYAVDSRTRSEPVFHPITGEDLIRGFGPGPGHKPLPAPRTSLIGREKELNVTTEMLLRENVRLLTLAGAGGSGKTRLGLEVAARMSEHFPAGVFFVALASITNPEDVAPLIAQALGLKSTGGKPLSEAMPEYLRLHLRAKALLVLDNFEHLLPAATLIAELLAGCAWLKVLVTSRAVLHLYGEQLYFVPPLQTPDLNRLPPLAALSENSAVALFVQRARAVKLDFALTENNAKVVAEICSRVDGLPLALELAAARIKMLSPKALLDRLRIGFDLLTGSTLDLPDRQRTLRRTIEWSHALLNPPEQKLFRRLSVFAGGCTLESVEAVCNVQRDLDISPLDGLDSLVNKSLLAQTSQDNGESRFQMLETIREFGFQQLAACGEMEITRRALGAYCLVLAEEGAQSMTVQGRENWLALCDSEHDNFRAALDWLLEYDHGEWALRLGYGLYHYWERREYLAEGRARLLSILNLKNAQGKTKLRAMVIEYAASLMTEMNDLDSSSHWHSEALNIYRTLADDRGIACSLNSLGVNRRMDGDLGAARSWFEHSLSVCERIGSEMEIAGAQSNLAQVVRAQGDYELAASLIEKSLALFRRLEANTFVAWSLNHLGDIARERGDPQQARQLYEEGADIFEGLEDRWGMARSRLDLGHLCCEGGDTEGATASFRMALEMFAQLDHKRGIAKVLEGFARLSVLERDYLRVR